MDETIGEYQLNVDLWKHDDAMRQAHNQTFLATNSAALVAAGLVIAASHSLAVQAGAAVVAAVFGFAVCGSWQTVQIRHNAYIRFHRIKLLSLEPATSYTTFQEQQRAFHDADLVSLAGSAGQTFELDDHELASSSSAEALLPTLLLRLWVVAGTAGVLGLVAAAI
jgi:hypothetical protein